MQTQRRDPSVWACMHEKFGELLDGFKLSPKLIPILKEQVRLVLEDSLKSFEGKRKDLLSQITQKENELEKLERRFAVGYIKEKMWKKHKRITQEEIKEIELKLDNLPSKKSNLAILDEKILSLLENPRQFWESINTKQKRRLQDVLFPDGLHYSPKTTEYRTSNIHLLLEITGCFIDTWTSEKNKTRRQNVFGSRVVDNSFEISNFKIWRSDLLETINTIQLFSKISLKENMSLTTTS